MIRSKYTISVRDSDELILFNTLRGTLSRFNCNISDQIEETLQFGNGTSNIVDFLKKEGHLISDYTEEEILLNNIREDARNSEQFDLLILPTEECNFRCKYCYESFQLSKMSDEVQLRFIDFFEQNIQNYKSVSVGWFGGEPLEALSVIQSLSEKMIKICKMRKVPYVANITTNGYNLDYDTFQLLRKLKIFNYQITLDGLKAQHDNQRVLLNGSEGSFDKIISNIKDIRYLCKSSTFKFSIRTNLTIDIIEVIDDYLDFLKDLIGDDSRFGVFWRLAGDWGNIQNKSIVKRFCTLEDYWSTLIKSSQMGLINQTLRYLIRPGGFICNAAKANFFVIAPDGEVRVCTCHMQEDINKMGVLKDKEVFIKNKVKSKIWSQPVDKEKCDNCVTKPICLGLSCPYYHNVENMENCAYDLKYINDVIKCLSKSEATCKYINEI